ncbi:LamG-like jellyroll fold domain-containing protein [Algibacter mikhailovii]|uniref:Secretion system C-terminal sorting domain-containing protein n=1 Tax=Algibacter mikhailovii TaxID=425498 RepID=A0A918QZ68_9FLAO|nr:LamG-like jellyroll fold domain-containing protein [Algibacter mikhailovii]GGZ77754.1 hypothetical protein GCM10007028_13830 [Algibacter mikhailovii]
MKKLYFITICISALSFAQQGIIANSSKNHSVQNVYNSPESTGLSESQTTQNVVCAIPPNSLISWWAAEDNANDSVGNNNGTPNGVSYSTGTVNSAFEFDGVNDVVNVPSSTNLDITGDVTVEFWALQTVFNEENTVLCKGTEDEKITYSIRFLGQIFQCVFKDNTGADIVLGGPAFEDFQWHHYAYVRQGNQHIIYADGFDFGWEMFANPPASSSGLPLTIGAQLNNQNSDYSNFFGGQLDEIGIYNRALSSIEIQSIFNAGASGKCINGLRVSNGSNEGSVLRIYPNPVKNVFTINLKSPSKDLKLKIYDGLGKVVKTVNELENNASKIDISELNNGMYLYSLYSQGHLVKSGKIIKN